MFTLSQLAMEGLLAAPAGKLLVALIGIGIVVLVGRLVLNMAWRLVKLATVVIGALWLISVAAPTLPF